MVFYIPCAEKIAMTKERVARATPKIVRTIDNLWGRAPWAKPEPTGYSVYAMEYQFSLHADVIANHLRAIGAAPTNDFLKRKYIAWLYDQKLEDEARFLELNLELRDLEAKNDRGDRYQEFSRELSELWKLYRWFWFGDRFFYDEKAPKPRSVIVYTSYGLPAKVAVVVPPSPDEGSLSEIASDVAEAFRRFPTVHQIEFFGEPGQETFPSEVIQAVRNAVPKDAALHRLGFSRLD